MDLYSVQLAITHETLEEISAALFELGTAGILEEEPCRWRAYFEDRESIASIVDQWPEYVLGEREEPPVQLLTALHEDSEPIYIGSRFVVTAAAASPVPERLHIVVDSVTAFGTGRHESTQLVMELLESIVRTNTVIFDVGCGSGILSEAARLLAPVRVVACDIDENAVRAVQSRFTLPVFLGSVDALPSASADLIFANISQKAVDALAPEIRRVLKPQGQVVIGGFTSDNLPARYRPACQLQKGDWLCWLCSRDDILAKQPARGQVLTHPLQWW